MAHVGRHRLDAGDRQHDGGEREERDGEMAEQEGQRVRRGEGLEDRRVLRDAGDAERQQRHVRQRQPGAQRAPGQGAREPHASPYPTPRRVVMTGAPRVSSLRRR